MPVYSVNGQEIHTVEEGLPTRQKAILVHGWSSSSFALSPLAALLSHALHTPVEDAELARIEQVAQFLSHSSIANGMNLAQRTRLAGQLRQMVLGPYTNLVDPQIDRQEMFIVQDGTVEVWSDLESPDEVVRQPQKVAVLTPGEMTGELTMLDQGTRTADLITGPQGATVLALDRERLLALREDDPELGSLLLWNIARAMSGRVRFILWQLQRAYQRARAEEKGRRLERPGDGPRNVTL